MATPASCNKLKTAIAERCQEIVSQTERWLEDYQDFVKARLPRGAFDPSVGPNPRKLRYGFAPMEERQYSAILSQGDEDGFMSGLACDGRDRDFDTNVNKTGAYGCDLPGQQLEGGYDVFSYELKGKAFETGYACAMDLLLKQSYNAYLDGLARALKREAVKHHCWQLEREVVELAKYNTSIVDGFIHAEGGFPVEPTGGLNLETVKRVFAILKAEGWTGPQVVGGVSVEAFEEMRRVHANQRGYEISTSPASLDTDYLPKMNSVNWAGITWVFSDFPLRGYLRGDGTGTKSLVPVRPTITRPGTGGGVVSDVNESYYSCKYYCDGEYTELYEAAFIIHPEFAKILSFRMPSVDGKSWSGELFNFDLRMIDGDTVTTRFGVQNVDNFKFFMRGLHAFSFEPENPELASVILYKASPYQPIAVAPTCYDANAMGTPDVPIEPALPPNDDGFHDCADPNADECKNADYPVFPPPTQTDPCPTDPGDAGLVSMLDCQAIQTANDVGTLRACVERRGGFTGAVTVDIATADDTAVAGTDYTAVSSTLSWADGEGGVKCIDIPILEGGAGGGLAFSLALSNPTGGAAIADDTTNPAGCGGVGVTIN